MEPRKSDTRPFDRRAIPAWAVESRWLAPDGAAIRRIDWPATGTRARGSLLFMPGRADFYEKYLETLEGWNRAGWRVTALDWRGQAGSGRLGPDGSTGHVSDFSVWVEDLGAFWNEWARNGPGPHVLIGHSMGGHLVLRALAEAAVRPDAAVLVAPMLGLLPRRLPDAVLHLVARAMLWLRGELREAWHGDERPRAMPGNRETLLTHDAERYADEAWWRAQRPALDMAAPSWGWIERAFASCRVLREKGALERIDTPVFIVATNADRLVDHAATARAIRRLPNADALVFGAEARHEILREVDPVRDAALAAIDRFLDRAAPSRP